MCLWAHQDLQQLRPNFSLVKEYQEMIMAAKICSFTGMFHWNCRAISKSSAGYRNCLHWLSLNIIKLPIKTVIFAAFSMSVYSFHIFNILQLFFYSPQ